MSPGDLGRRVGAVAMDGFDSHEPRDAGDAASAAKVAG
jgi:hypothetical protein